MAGLSRRDFLRVVGGAGAGLTIAISWRAAAAPPGPTLAPAAFAPNAFVRVTPDNTVTVVVKHLEMGQGVSTGLATLVAEEMDADWGQMRTEAAPADATRYANLFWGVQGTGGSTSMANAFEQMRRAGAVARALLVEAAARQWGVAAADISVVKGIVSHDGKVSGFGPLAAAAARLPVPPEVPLKRPEAFTLIGTTLPRKDAADKISGAAVFASDLDLPGLLTAVVARPPRFGARVKGFAAAAAMALPGVVAVVEILRGVAVVGQGFWAAKTGREALRVAWDDSAAYKLGSAELLPIFRTLAIRPGRVARDDGDAIRALPAAARRLEAEYVLPYLAHAPMEPLSAVARLSEAGLEIWAGSQLQTADRAAAAQAAGLALEQVTLHTLPAGGSFGRRATPDSDYIAEVAGIARGLRQQGIAAPVKLLWTREDDITGGRYRPMALHRLQAGLSASGQPVAWRHHIVTQSILTGTPFAGAVQDGIDRTSVEGAASLPYAVPHLRVELSTPDVGVPVLWWRSVGSSHNAYATEVFLDQIAAAAGRDPLALRADLLAGQPRHRAVLELAADKAGWGAPLGPGRGRGVAVHESFGSVVAQVAEVTVDGSGAVVVDKVVCAVDCGLPVNPDVIRAQVEGSVAFGLGAFLDGRITLADGVVQQSNFGDYPILRIDRMPRVEVHIVPSAVPPTGIGEPAVPPVAPAVANAIFAASGRHVTTLPLAG